MVDGGGIAKVEAAVVSTGIGEPVSYRRSYVVGLEKHCEELVRQLADLQLRNAALKEKLTYKGGDRASWQAERLLMTNTILKLQESNLVMQQKNEDQRSLIRALLVVLLAWAAINALYMLFI